MDWSAIAQSLMNGGSLGGSVMAGFQKQPAAYTQQPVPPMSQPMYQNALAQPTQQAPVAQAPSMAGAPGMPGAPQQHGVFSQLVKAFAGGM